VIVGNLAINHSALSPRNAGVGDEDVESTVELCNNDIDGLLYQRLVSNIDLIGTACGFQSGHIYFDHGIKTKAPILDAVCFLNIRSTVKCLFVAIILGSNVCSGFCKALGNSQANSGAGARGDSSFAP